MTEYAVPDHYTVSVDFDGVLHSYVSGWVAPDVIPDAPVEGAIKWLNEVAEHYEVVILTTRARYPEAIPAVEAWLREHGFVGDCVVTAEKGPAVIYIDDRGWRFRGEFPSVRTIRYAHPWRVGNAPRKSVKEVVREANLRTKTIEQRQSQLKLELRQTKLALVLEILRDLTDEARATFLREHEELPWEKRIESAREVAGQ